MHSAAARQPGPAPKSRDETITAAISSTKVSGNLPSQAPNINHSAVSAPTTDATARTYLKGVESPRLRARAIRSMSLCSASATRSNILLFPLLVCRGTKRARPIDDNQQKVNAKLISRRCEKICLDDSRKEVHLSPHAQAGLNTRTQEIGMGPASGKPTPKRGAQMDWLKALRWRVARAGEIWIEPADGVGKRVAVLSMENEDAARYAELFTAVGAMYAALEQAEARFSAIDAETNDAVETAVRNALAMARGEGHAE